MKKNHSLYRLFLLSNLLIGWQSAQAFPLLPIKDEDLTPAEKAWLEDDSNLNISVNEGQLTYVDPALTEGNYALENRLRILKDATQTQQIEFTQCHKNLDAINSIEIVYNPKTTTNLDVLSSTNIANIEVGADKVALSKVQKGAQICIRGISTTLTYNPTLQVWELPRGPYMRKFLDGYYPMHLQEVLELGESNLAFVKLQIKNGPAIQPLKQIGQNANGTTVTFDYYFEGRLQPTYQFGVKAP
ncbi:hypothetical protein [Thiosulfatimonas sediminis]|nr:hypothetical protein [Thiosulfatimonas sediminis]